MTPDVYNGSIVVLILLIIFLISKVKSKNKTIKNIKKDYEECNDARLLALQQKDNHLSNNNLLNKRYNTLYVKYNSLENQIKTIVLNPLKYISFHLPNGIIANTVKVKTITSKDIKNPKIIKIEATVRKKVDTTYKDIKVKTVLTLPTLE